MSKHPYFGKDGLGGGLCSENAIILQPNQMSIADNVLIGTAITRRKRGGTEKFHTGTADTTADYPSNLLNGGGTEAIRGLIEFWRTAGYGGSPVSDIFLHQGDKVWSIEERNTIAVDRTGSLTLSPDAVPCYQPFNGKLYFTSTDTQDGYNKWDGASASAVAATAPADGPGKYIIEHMGRMVMAGNDDFPFRVYFSTAFNPENWSSVAPGNATSLDLVDDGDPEGITGLASFQNRLYVWTRRKLYEITGTTPDTFIVQPVSSGIGCIGHASIVQVPNDIVFASDRGVHSLKQLASGRQSESQFLSRDIQKLWTTLLNTALYSRIKALYDERTNNVLFSVPSSGQLSNDSILTFNIEFGTWTTWPEMDCRSLSLFMVSNRKEIVAGREDGTLVLLNQSAAEDLGEGYTARFKTGVLYPGGDLTVERYFKNITVFASTTKPSNFSVSWTIDGNKSGSKSIELTAGEDVLGTAFTLGQSALGVGQYVPRTISIDDIGYGIQIEVTVGGTSDIEFYGFILEVDNANPNYT